MKTINLYGYFGFDNVGDDLMLLNLLDYIDLNINEKILIRVFSKKNDYKFKKYNNIYVNLIRLTFITNKFLMSYYILNSSAGFWVGGTCLYEPDNKNISGLIWLQKLVKKYNNKFSFINIGIGHLETEKAKHLVKSILLNVNKSSFRDRISLQKAESILQKTNFVMGGDMVFLNNPLPRLNSINPQKYLGFAGHSQYQNNSKVIDFYTKLLQEVSANYEKIIFISMHGNEDHKFHKKIAYSLDKKCLFINYKDHIELFHKMRQLHFLIGMRLHSIVLADLLAIPNIGISYGEKVSNYIKKSYMLETKRIKQINEVITAQEIEYISKNYKYNKEFILKEKADAGYGIKQLLLELNL